MKTKLLFGLTFLAIGFGVSHVLLQGQDPTPDTQIAHPHASQSPAAHVSMVAHPVAEVEDSVADTVPKQFVPPPVAEASVKESSVSETSEPNSDGDNFYYLLHPDRKPKEEIRNSSDSQK